MRYFLSKRWNLRCLLGFGSLDVLNPYAFDVVATHEQQKFVSVAFCTNGVLPCLVGVERLPLRRCCQAQRVAEAGVNDGAVTVCPCAEFAQLEA